MPRRPSKVNKANHKKSKPPATNRPDARIKKWNKKSDIPLDDEDAFHASRDEILLDGHYDDDQDVVDEEVFALHDVSDDEEGSENLEEDEDEAMGEWEEDETPLPTSTSKAKGGKKGKSKAPSTSESEDASESEQEGWGHGRNAYYASNAAELESDDEEGNALEEQEAVRLQTKIRSTMVDDDFGLGEEPIEDRATEAVISPTSLAPVPMPVMDTASAVKHLEKTDPESVALARDWNDAVQNLAQTQKRVAALAEDRTSAPKSWDSVSLGMVHLHYQALLSYTTTLAFYLYLRASEKYARHPDLLKSHPIINRLLTLKQTIATLEDLDFAADSEEGGDDELLEGEYDEDFLREARAIWAEEHGFSMDLDDEQDELVSSDPIVPEVQKKKKRKEKEDTKDESSHPKKKRKTKSSGDVRLPVFDLEEPEFVSSKKPPQTDVAASNVDTYGENTALDHTDATDKNIKKKSLRFHTSKIESASARRRGARNAALGGDDDLPYRKREKELGAKAVKDAKARLKKQGGADLDDADPEPRKDDNSSWDDGGDGEEADDGDSYYNLVKQSVKAKKDQKKTEYEAVNRVEFDEGEDDGTGPRSLTRTILSNKGLTPHRSKSVRNPRVKKRQKYDKAKKKLSSQKAVYKGGISSSGHYEGERTGITKVVKSVKLG